jgi:hypothetical protein
LVRSASALLDALGNGPQALTHWFWNRGGGLYVGNLTKSLSRVMGKS